MRNDETWLIDDGIGIEGQIEIERTRCAAVRPRSAELLLDSKKPPQQGVRIQGGCADHGTIQHRRLNLSADIWRVVERRGAKIPDERPERLDRSVQDGAPITDIAPESDGDMGA